MKSEMAKSSIKCAILFGFKVWHEAAFEGQFNMCKFLVEEVGVYIDDKTHRGVVYQFFIVDKLNVDFLFNVLYTNYCFRGHSPSSCCQKKCIS